MGPNQKKIVYFIDGILENSKYIIVDIYIQLNN